MLGVENRISQNKGIRKKRMMSPCGRYRAHFKAFMTDYKELESRTCYRPGPNSWLRLIQVSPEEVAIFVESLLFSMHSVTILRAIGRLLPDYGSEFGVTPVETG